MMEEVCVVGGGVSGIIACKLALDKGLVPVVYEKSESFGGIWRGAAGQIGCWENMRTNLTRFFMMFSDQLWPDGTSAYPLCSEYLRYLADYVEKHQLLQYFSFGLKVTRIEKSENGYLVSHLSASGTHSREFKYVLVGIGKNSKYIDSIKGKERFRGEILNAGFYRNSQVFSGKNVVVVGNSYSACEICCDAVKTGNSVTQIYKRKSCIHTKITKGVPFEFNIFRNNKLKSDGPLYYSHEANSRVANYLISMNGNPGTILPEWHITEEDLKNDFVVLSFNSEHYYELVKQRKISCVQGCASEYGEDGVVLSSGQLVPADIVIDATGYIPDFDFLSEEIKEILDYSPNHSRLPLLLFRDCIHPDLPGLGFIGNIGSIILGLFELTSELCLRWFKGELNLTYEEMKAGILGTKEIREISKKGNYLDSCGIQKEVLRILDIKFEQEFLDELDYRNGFIGPALFFIEREGQRELARKWIRDVKEEFPFIDFNN